MHAALLHVSLVCYNIMSLYKRIKQPRRCHTLRHFVDHHQGNEHHPEACISSHDIFAPAVHEVERHPTRLLTVRHRNPERSINNTAVGVVCSILNIHMKYRKCYTTFSQRTSGAAYTPCGYCCAEYEEQFWIPICSLLGDPYPNMSVGLHPLVMFSTTLFFLQNHPLHNKNVDFSRKCAPIDNLCYIMHLQCIPRGVDIKNQREKELESTAIALRSPKATSLKEAACTPILTYQKALCLQLASRCPNYWCC
eukprot:284816338_2